MTRLAVFTPLPPQRSGIADYATHLIRAMTEHAAIDVFLPASAPEPAPVDVPVIRYEGLSTMLPDLTGYDGVIYHVGNALQFHGEMLMVAARHPGIVVLHDVALHDLFLGLYGTTLGRPEVYAAEAEYADGDEGRLFAEVVLSGNTDDVATTSATRLPLNRRLVEAAVGVIVHSKFAERQIVATSLAPCRQIVHFGRSIEPPADPIAGRRRWNVPADGMLIGAFGDVIRSKRIDILLEALAALSDDTTLVTAGSGIEILQPEIERLGLADRVIRLPWLDEDSLDSVIALCDVIVNLRNPTRGETSGIAMRALSAARPLIVSRGGWYDEIPTDAVLRVPTDDTEQAVLIDHLQTMRDPTRRHQMSEAAGRFAATHSIEAAAAAYVDFACSLADETLQGALVARLIRDLGMTSVPPSGVIVDTIADVLMDLDPRS